MLSEIVCVRVIYSFFESFDFDLIWGLFFEFFQFFIIDLDISFQFYVDSINYCRLKFVFYYEILGCDKHDMIFGYKMK